MTNDSKSRGTGGGNYRWVGNVTRRPDGVDKVTGRARYGDDMVLPGMLHMRTLRSPHAHAKILSIDTSEAEAMKGVKVVDKQNAKYLKQQAKEDEKMQKKRQREVRATYCTTLSHPLPVSCAPQARDR